MIAPTRMSIAFKMAPAKKHTPYAIAKDKSQLTSRSRMRLLGNRVGGSSFASCTEHDSRLNDGITTLAAHPLAASEASAGRVLQRVMPLAQGHLQTSSVAIARSARHQLVRADHEHPAVRSTQAQAANMQTTPGRGREGSCVVQASRSTLLVHQRLQPKRPLRSGATPYRPTGPQALPQRRSSTKRLGPSLISSNVPSTNSPTIFAANCDQPPACTNSAVTSLQTSPSVTAPGARRNPSRIAGVKL